MPLSPRVPDLAALDLLLSVIELGSLGRAAQAHGISQPSASSRIRYLERLVGTAVLERTTLGSRPTPAGALIAEWARRVIDAAEQLDAGLDTLRTERDSRLRVAASQTVAEYLFPGWLMTMRAAAPEVTIALEAGNSVEVAQAVLDGKAGIGFVESPQPFPGLESHEVARDTLVVVVAPQHEWARRGSVGLAELAATPLIQREPGSGSRTLFETVVAQALPDWVPNIALELSSTTAIKTSVAADVGVSVLSSLAVASDVAAGHLVVPEIPDLDLRRSLRAVWPVGQRLSGPARELYSIALRAFS
ncbi:LysR family transcriptional regulator [Nocardia goodfellowii]|uniref:Molybdate transport repressor ModE-like protein n=1 Tax=Nocardia goodfellowii TaxID=882446 RepID=A0ABS4QRX5_9NOCA|nr:LysR family transcriptional regulator [Nocardia goodfellowii]MBP2194457.1 molybdate transport repressor ModE-like protein [Nocardia goodfellowii]